MDCASSSSSCSSKWVRGCQGLGRIASTGISRRPALARGMSAPRPRPRPRSWAGLIRAYSAPRAGPHFEAKNSSTQESALDELLGQIGIRARPARGRLVLEHRLAITRRFAQANAARDDGLEGAVWKMAAYFVDYLRRQPRSRVKHRHQHPQQLEPRVQGSANELDR